MDSSYHLPPIRFYDLIEERECREIDQETDVRALVLSRDETYLGVLSDLWLGVIEMKSTVSSATRLRSPTIGFELALSEDGKLLIWKNGVVGVGWFGQSGWNLETWEDVNSVSEKEYQAAVEANRRETIWKPESGTNETRFIDENTDPLVWARLMTVDGAQVKTPGTDELIDPPFRRVE